ncbi:MAG: dihydroorotate dehydrogenase electron transfer subunit [Syntrophales bacterium]
MHQTQSVLGDIIENRTVAPGHFQMTIRLPGSFPPPVPGQFLMVRSVDQEEPLLARPFSVYGFQRHQGETAVDLLYRTAGRGTALLSRLGPGARLALLGPLGRGFAPPEGMKKVILLAGGVGVAPLVFLLRSGWLTGVGTGTNACICYVGARTGEHLTGLERLHGADLHVCTDDGSRAFCGQVTDLLRRDIGEYVPEETMIYACGPSAMIRTLGHLLRDRPIRCQVSLEERMACGLGACLGCAVAVRGEAGRREFRRVCKDGPVFDLREILFASPAGVKEGQRNG